MTMIEKTWTRFPGDPLRQDAIIKVLPRWLKDSELRLADQLFRRAAVSSRHMVLHPAELALTGRTFAEKNKLYKQAVHKEVGALSADIQEQTTESERRSIDLLITASCTGFQIPAMDALVIKTLNLP